MVTSLWSQLQGGGDKRKKESGYQKQGDVCEEGSSDNQQHQRPGKPEPQDNPENNNEPVICALWLLFTSHMTVSDIDNVFYLNLHNILDI